MQASSMRWIGAVTALVLAATLTACTRVTIVAPTPSPSPGQSPPGAEYQCQPETREFNAASIDLTGKWYGDDNFVYYLRQADKVLWWTGLSIDGPESNLGRRFTNVYRGTISGTKVTGEWVDVPRAPDLGGGKLVLQVQKGASGSIEIVKAPESSPDYGGSRWIPCREASP